MPANTTQLLPGGIAKSSEKKFLADTKIPGFGGNFWHPFTGDTFLAINNYKLHADEFSPSTEPSCLGSSNIVNGKKAGA